ncbi:hypothetical protein COCC4DRAFT_123192 [Bipolaris maydis ATCC 48331]|uniref:Uncharacterized protein n=2 Tax=Cochliobolus heterostrophus TaxID=5016 RepID=M2UBD4_COCH5|nr:uncharacterized protein COCC4DRAFT_123192 [Bipolaris maydis ATCC 48331]EMD95854.1 hypothetical protein COCHEDRAFT_1088157 [Bipolaris maydis C5]ENI10714.1 hypothetical protein COCC4DRAFT_123192 [Bipolaris maydis ATCC 48331]KAJ6213358.1 hypothetical protein PSV09DRAFT_1088157 [Bipolaris maydis]KAJ6274590.1 hypothetical protein PSV08DRAFT_171959 [Bipolaris maydis]
MSIYDIPPSPPEPVHVHVYSNNKHKNKSQHLSDSTRIIPSKRKPGASFMNEKAKKHLITRKRRLPVHRLALLRTTTGDGLPQSSDMEVTFFRSIAVTDPIEDSQLDGPIIDPLGGPICNIVTLGKTPLAHTAQHSDVRNIPTKGAPDRASAAHETLKETSSLTPKQIPDVHLAHDGRIDHELQTALMRQSDRQGNYLSARTRRPGIFRTLTLGSGPLPSPADAFSYNLQAMQRDEQEAPGSRNLHRLQNRLTGPKSMQLTLISSLEYLRRLPVLSPPKVSGRVGP